jgi:hypothetical protein
MQAANTIEGTHCLLHSHYQHYTSAVFCTSTDGDILSKYSQDIAAKPPQELRMIASFNTMGLVPKKWLRQEAGRHLCR